MHGDNVVIFPKTKNNAPPETIEELKTKLASSKMQIADFMAEEIVKEVIRMTADSGYALLNYTDMAFLMITVKAMVLRTEGIYHPVQDFIDENINYKATSDTYNIE